MCIIYMFDSFNEGSLDLDRLKYALITLIPKEQGANAANEFRPIILENIIIKLI